MKNRGKKEGLGSPQSVCNRFGRLCAALLVTLLTGSVVLAQGRSDGRQESGQALRLEKIGTSEKSFHVVSTLILGPTESILWDSLYKVSDGRLLAERIAEMGTRLKAVVLSHADHDHYMGVMEVLRRFPDTPLYMTQSGLEDFAARSERDLAYENRKGPNPEAPDRLPEPRLLPPGPLVVDGQEILVLDGLVGDVSKPAGAALWIPSLRTVLAGDTVFEGIHLWLGDSNRASRVAWRESLQRLAGLDPVAVVPGHKRDLATPDSPAQIDFMIQYLDDYDALMEEASSAEDVIEGMVARYPDLALPRLMAYGARKWFKK